MDRDISVMLSTYNRAQFLKRTLEGFAETDRSDLSVEFMIIDNGSSDNTRQVIESFKNRMNIKYIFEPINGKNRALNTAIETCSLGDIVVFTDDDVDVPRNWLKSIHAVCQRWPDHSLFGGRIDVVFPPVTIPQWSDDPMIAALAFAKHDVADHECEYRDYDAPFGPNYWVRKVIFENGRRFDESIGPKLKNRMMGSETSFFKSLIDDGYKIVYSPAVSVNHRIQKDVLTLSSIWKRSYRLGRGNVIIHGLPRQKLLKNHAWIWQWTEYVEIFWNVLVLIFKFIYSSSRTRPVKTVKPIINIAYHCKALSDSRR